jgi:hypothetical protein
MGCGDPPKNAADQPDVGHAFDLRVDGYLTFYSGKSRRHSRT